MNAKIQKLKNGKYLGCSVIQIIKIPAYLQSTETSKGTHNYYELKQMMRELYAGANTNQMVVEILWTTKESKSSVCRAQICLYIVLRVIGGTVSETQRILRTNTEIVKRQLAIGKYIYRELSEGDAEFNPIPETVQHISALVKAERVDCHSQAQFPYYYVEQLSMQEDFSLTELTNALSAMENCIFSIQLFPITLSVQEKMTFAEYDACLSQILAGIPYGQYGYYRDSAAQNAYTNIHRFNQESSSGAFLYNILIAGTRSQCNTLSSHIISLYNGVGSSELKAIELGNIVDLRRQFVYYPWNLNKKLVYECRNGSLWNDMLIPTGLFRFPYILTASELGGVTSIPVQDNSIEGLSSYIPVDESYDFDKKVFNSDNLLVGNLLYKPTVSMGIPKENLTTHMLVTGKSGCGKTTFLFHLLTQLNKANIPFLAIEPTKTEYRALIDKIPNLRVFTPGNNSVSPFVYNPFIPPKGITLEEYIPCLASAFRAAFSMPGPLVEIFLSAVRETYVAYGWRDYCTSQDDNAQPFGLNEFIRIFGQIIDRENYSREVKGNLRSAGIVRLRNLVEQNPNIYDTIHSVSVEELLSQPTIIELNAIHNEEQKSVLMALILIGICIHTKHSEASAQASLRNVLLIDEAHVLFGAKDRYCDGAAEGASSTVKSLENMLVEIRHFGTGIIIADQSPVAVGNNVVKSTDCKITFQLIAQKDRDQICSSTIMSSSMQQAISKLSAGQAVLDFGLLKTPVLIATPNVRTDYNIRKNVLDFEIKKQMESFWREHSELLIPYNECSFSKCCRVCNMKIRSDATYWATKYWQQFSSKILDVKTLYGYLIAMDTWLNQENLQFSKQEQLIIHNCAKIKLLRKAIHSSCIQLSNDMYYQLLNQILKN